DVNVIQAVLLAGGGVGAGFGGGAAVGFVAGAVFGGVRWQLVLFEVRIFQFDHLTDEVDILVAGVGFIVGERRQRFTILALRHNNCVAVFVFFHDIIAHIFDPVIIAG